MVPSGGELWATDADTRDDVVAQWEHILSPVSDPNVPKSVPKLHENGPRRILRGPFPLVAGTVFDSTT